MLNLKEILVEKQKSQVWLSEQLGVTTISVHNWVKNKNQPSIETALKICSVLEVKISELIIQETKK